MGYTYILWPHWWHMEVPGPEIESGHRYDLHRSCSNAGSFNALRWAGERTRTIAATQATAVGFFFFFFFFFFFRAAPLAYGGSQARGRIGAADAGLHHSHSNTKSELHLQPTPQLTATPDP